jgi:hypothetical protein
MDRLASVSRRDFLRASAAMAGTAALGPRAYARVLGSNDRTNIAISLGVRSFRDRKVYGWNASEQKVVAAP